MNTAEGKEGYCSVFFSALANRLRIRILQELSLGPMSVNKLSERLGAERTLVSHNLAMLAKAELVRCSPAGKARIYSGNEFVVPYVFFLLERVVCAKCSLRKTCIALKKREAVPMPERVRPPCAACR
jgi:DNA-binding transcriptional ArsR family regulator